LSRKKNERIRIRPKDGGSDIWLTVTDIDRGKIRIGITAAYDDYQIEREEIISQPDSNRDTAIAS